MECYFFTEKYQRPHKSQSVEKHPPLLDNAISPARGSGGSRGRKWKERTGNEKERMEEDDDRPVEQRDSRFINITMMSNRSCVMQSRCI